MSLSRNRWLYLFIVSLTFFMGGCSTAQVREPAICPEAAFIEIEEYGLLPLESRSNEAFKLWVAEMAYKYPNLLLSHKLLQDCWHNYHPETRT